jgi:Tol biopolymer transport system component
MDARGHHEHALTRPRPPAAFVSWSSGGRLGFVSDGLERPEIWAASEDGTNLRRLTWGDNPAWSPDGRRIASARHYWRDVANLEPGQNGRVAAAANGIFVIDSDGSGLRRVASLHGSSEAPVVSWSPRGDALVFSTSRAIWRVDLARRTDVALLEHDELWPPDVAWSPDGSLIAIRLTQGLSQGIFVLKPDGTGLRRVTGASDAEGLSWRLDGTVTFMTYYGGADTVRAVAPTGGRTRVLFSVDAPLFPRLSWSADGTRAVVSSQYGGWDPLVVSADGSSRQRILHGERHLGAAWSPDGARLAIVTDGRLVVRDANGRLTRFDAHCAPPLSWAPDGRRLACNAKSEGAVRLVTLGRGGKATQRDVLTYAADKFEKRDADWSLDGRRLIYASPDTHTLVLFDPAYPTRRKATSIPIAALHTNPATPRWSPDGRQVVFASSCVLRAPPCRPGIFVVRLDGHDARRISRDGAHPEWSPDGRRIVFDTVHRGNRDIYIMRTDGSHRLRLTSDPAPDTAPRWRR